VPGHTARLNLYQPGGGTEGTHGPDEQADIDRINDDLVIIDGAVGAPSATSGSRPASPYDGQLIYETDTKKIKIFVTSLGTWQDGIVARATGAIFPTADMGTLNALTGMVSGDQATVAEGNIEFFYTGAAWLQTNIAVFATLAARDTAYARAAGAYRVVGAQCILLTSPLILMELAGTAATNWQKKGLNKPSAAVATGGTATINDDGSVTVVFTGAGNVILTNAFGALVAAATDGWDVELVAAGTASQFSWKWATAGVPDVVATNHDYYGVIFNQTGAPAASTALAGASSPISAAIAGIAFEATLQVRHAMDNTKPSRADLTYQIVTTVGSSESGFYGKIGNRANTLFDGFQIVVTAACTLTIKVKPRA
jgi:hypothetical protein